MTNEIDETKDEHDWEEEVRGACRAHLMRLRSSVRDRHARETAVLDLVVGISDGETMTATMALQLVGGLEVLSEANPRHRLAVEILLDAAGAEFWD